MENYMSDIYKDFFSKPLIEDSKIEQDENIDLEQIDNLPITEESKTLLKRIIEYMQLYKEEKEKNYIAL